MGYDRELFDLSASRQEFGVAIIKKKIHLQCINFLEFNVDALNRTQVFYSFITNSNVSNFKKYSYSTNLNVSNFKKYGYSTNSNVSNFKKYSY